MSEETGTTTEAAPPEQAEAPAQENGDNGASEAPDLSQAIASIEAKLDRLAPEEAPPADLAALLTPQVDEPEEIEQEGYGAYVDPNEERLSNLEQAYLAKLEEERDAKISALTDKYEGIEDSADEIFNRLLPIAQRYGDPDLIKDPALVEQAYLAIRAEADASSQTSAEEARGRGAKLETDASASGATKEDPDREFIDAFGANRGKSAFG